MDPSLTQQILRNQENLLVLDVVQAALGMISPQMWAIKVDRDADQAHLYIAVRERDAQVNKNVDDLILKLRALHSTPLDIQAHISVCSPYSDWPGSEKRGVYLEKYAENPAQ